MTNREYVQAFKDWMIETEPDAFVTIDFPGARRAPRSPGEYLNLLTRMAEADLLGPRTLKIHDFKRRIVWRFRPETSPGGMFHYHGAVSLPENRRWRDEDASDLPTRCKRLQEALRTASRRIPEPHCRPKRKPKPTAMMRRPAATRSPQLCRAGVPISTTKKTTCASRSITALPDTIRHWKSTIKEAETPAADIDVRPFHAESHAAYMLKELLWGSMAMANGLPEDDDRSVTDGLKDSQLLILPHFKIHRKTDEEAESVTTGGPMTATTPCVAPLRSRWPATSDHDALERVITMAWTE